MAAITFGPPTQATYFSAGNDHRSLPTRIWHVVQAIFRFIAYHFTKFGQQISFLLFKNKTLFPKPQADGSFDLASMPWNRGSSDGLFFMIHGLNSSPRRWMYYIHDLIKKAPTHHHIAPFVPKGGHCSLAEASTLLSLVQDYADKHPGKPIHLIGASNGTRIASYIESHVNLSPGSTISVTSITGVHQGSSVVSRFANRTLKRIGIPDSLSREIVWLSPTANNLLGEWRVKQTLWKIQNVSARHFFFASTEDEIIRPIASALPLLANSSYHIYHGHSHSSLVDAVREKVLSLLLVP